MKISTSLFFDRALNQMVTTQNSLAQSQAQLSTRKKVVQVSDAPDEATAIDGLVQALREAYQQPDDAARRGQRARQRVLDEYTWAAKLDAAEALYARVLGGATGASQAASEPARVAVLRT